MLPLGSLTPARFPAAQVKSNLLGRVPGAEKLYIPCKEVDGSSSGAGEPPCFYSLTHSDNGATDPPRLDGLVREGEDTC